MHLKIIKALDEKDKKLMIYDLHVEKNFLKETNKKNIRENVKFSHFIQKL